MHRLKIFFKKYSIFIFFTFLVIIRTSVITLYISKLHYDFTFFDKLNLILLNIKNDIQIWLFFCIFSVVLIQQYHNQRKKLYYLLLVIFLVCIDTYIIDMGSLIFFGVRFHVLKYIRNIILCNKGLLILIFFSIAIFIFLDKLIQKTSIYFKFNFLDSKKNILFYYCFSFLVIFLIGIFINPQEISKKLNFDVKLLTDNFLKINSSLNYFIPYFNYKELYKQYDNYFVTEKGLNEKKNIILVISESLSAMNSKRISDIFNYLPKIDNITKEGKLFKNMIAGGYGTRFALHSIIEGDFTLGGILGGFYFKEKYNIPLGSFFNDLGYQTYFLAGCPLSFNHDFKFIKKCGYKFIYDSSNKFYKKFKKYTFNSPPDEALYKFALIKIKNLIQDKKKFFITMLTISGHTPYFSPYGYGEKKVFHYIDDSFAKFYSKLKRIKFFKNGILIICGDHRQFAMLKQEEIKKYKEKYAGRVVCFIIGKGIKKNIIDENYYNQNDIYYSLIKHFGDGKIKIFKYYNDIFTGKIRRNFALTYPSESKSSIYVYTKNGFGKIILKGQWSYFEVANNLSCLQKKKILNLVNIFRNYQLGKTYHLF